MAYAESPSETDRSFAAVERLLDSADFEGAERAGARLLGSGALSRNEVARAHLELGIIHGARGLMADAELDFLRALVLDAGASLPATVGPEVGHAFARARRKLETEPPFTVRVEIDRTDRAAGVFVKSFIQGVRVGLLERLEVQATGLHQQVALDENAPFATYRARMPDSVCRPLLIRLGDRYGNELWRFQESPNACEERHESTVRAAPNLHAQSQAAVSTRRRSLSTPVWVGAVISANLVIATGVLGIAALNARADYHRIIDKPEVSISQKQSEHDHASRVGDFATLAAIGAVTGIGTTVLLYVSQPRGSSRGAAASPRIGLDVGPRRALAGLRFEF